MSRPQAGDTPDGAGLDRLAAELIHLPELAPYWGRRRLAAGETLFERGDAADAFYAIEEGRLEVHATDAAGGRLVLEELGPGQHLGELALILDDVRAASASALTDCRLLCLSRRDFRALLATSPSLSALTIAMLGTRLRRTSGYLGHLSRWASLVAKGDYDQARRAAEAEAERADDANVARFLSTFNAMIASVQAREQSLRGELSQLRIEIDRRRLESQLEEITETEFFRQLQARAEGMRSQIRGPAPRERGPIHEDD